MIALALTLIKYVFLVLKNKNNDQYSTYIQIICEMWRSAQSLPVPSSYLYWIDRKEWMRLNQFVWKIAWKRYDLVHRAGVFNRQRNCRFIFLSAVAMQGRVLFRFSFCAILFVNVRCAEGRLCYVLEYIIQKFEYANKHRITDCMFVMFLPWQRFCPFWKAKVAKMSNSSPL